MKGIPNFTWLAHSECPHCGKMGKTTKDFKCLHCHKHKSLACVCVRSCGKGQVCEVTMMKNNPLSDYIKKHKKELTKSWKEGIRKVAE
jgi:hypothetical protein